jgi:hypothetical protein
VEEGRFVSDEPSEVLGQQLELPNQKGALNEEFNQALIEKLAEQLGIDPQYISLNGPVDGASRQRALSEGLAFHITILLDNSGALAVTLEALTSDPSFWQGVNARLVENNATTILNTSGIAAQAAVPACNKNFNYDNATKTCVTVPISCGVGTFAVAGTGLCVDCPASKYSRTEGSSICERCIPGQYSHSTAFRCNPCSSGYYQSDSGNEDGLTSKCQHCPWGKFQNLNGSVFCEEIWSNHLLVMIPTNGFEQRQCPRLGVLCENNSKRYTG